VAYAIPPTIPYFNPRLAALVIDLANIQDITRLLVNSHSPGALLFLPAALKKSPAVLATGDNNNNRTLERITSVHCQNVISLRISTYFLCSGSEKMPIDPTKPGH